MRMLSMLAIGAMGLVAACVQQQQKLVSTAPYNSGEMAWALGAGTNTVNGFAVLRTVGGEARTCAALPVRLIPDSPLARERMMGLYLSTSQGTNPAAGRKYDEATTDPNYVAHSRETRCDGQGNFSFEKVPNGVWYVVAGVVWSASPRSGVLEGGSMMKRVELKGGETVKVALP